MRRFSQIILALACAIGILTAPLTAQAASTTTSPTPGVYVYDEGRQLYLVDEASAQATVIGDPLAISATDVIGGAGYDADHKRIIVFLSTAIGELVLLSVDPATGLSDGEVTISLSPSQVDRAVGFDIAPNGQARILIDHPTAGDTIYDVDLATGAASNALEAHESGDPFYGLTAIASTASGELRAYGDAAGAAQEWSIDTSTAGIAELVDGIATGGEIAGADTDGPTTWMLGVDRVGGAIDFAGLISRTVFGFALVDGIQLGSSDVAASSLVVVPDTSAIVASPGLYVVDYDTAQLYSLDQQTAEASAIGAPVAPGGLSAMIDGTAYSPVTGLIYSIAHGNGHDLVAVRPDTGRAVAITPVTGSFQQVWSPVIDALGIARVLLSDSDGIHFVARIDLSTGVVDTANALAIRHGSDPELRARSLSVSPDGDLSYMTESSVYYSLADPDALVVQATEVIDLALANYHWAGVQDSAFRLWLDTYDTAGSTLWMLDTYDATPATPATLATEIGVINASMGPVNTGALFTIAPPINPGLSTSEPIVDAGAVVTLTGSGFSPRGDVRLELHSTPVVLGTVKADADGTFTLRVTIPSNATGGVHTIHAFDLRSGMTPTNNITVRAILPPTGADSAGTAAAIAIGLLAAGIALRLRARRASAIS